MGEQREEETGEPAPGLIRSEFGTGAREGGIIGHRLEAIQDLVKDWRSTVSKSSLVQICGREFDDRHQLSGAE